MLLLVKHSLYLCFLLEHTMSVGATEWNCPNTRNQAVDAIRQIATVKDHQLVLNLPAYFEHQQVEVIVLPCGTDSEIAETALLSESVLARDWERPEEDTAWAHLQ